MNVPAETERLVTPELQDKGGWPRNRWAVLIVLVFAMHVALIFAFGRQKPIVSRAVADVPALQLASGTNELLSLNDPSLFALPRPEDFAYSAWLQPQHVEFHRLEWTEPPRWLQFSGKELATVFNNFMETNHFASLQLELKPRLELSAPKNVPPEPLAENSTLQIEGDLTQRPLLKPITLPSLPDNDVLMPSHVQVMVDATGHVASAALITSSGLDDADDLALEFARALRFAPLPEGIGITSNPASRLTFGQLIFDWHTIPLSATNAPNSP
jgi:TonB family protein